VRPSLSSTPKALPLGILIVFITIRVSAVICREQGAPTLRRERMETMHEPPPLGASGGSLLASKPGLFLASAEAPTTFNDSSGLWRDANFPSLDPNSSLGLFHFLQHSLNAKQVLLNPFQCVHDLADRFLRIYAHGVMLPASSGCCLSDSVQQSVRFPTTRSISNIPSAEPPELSAPLAVDGAPWQPHRDVTKLLFQIRTLTTTSPVGPMNPLTISENLVQS